LLEKPSQNFNDCPVSNVGNNKCSFFFTESQLLPAEVLNRSLYQEAT